jgi:hypothetical protein
MRLNSTHFLDVLADPTAPIWVNMNSVPSRLTGYGAHLASYTVSTAAFCPWVKRQGCEDYHSPPSSA